MFKAILFCQYEERKNCFHSKFAKYLSPMKLFEYMACGCLLYTSDAADDWLVVYISVVAVSLKKIFFKQKTAY